MNKEKCCEAIAAAVSKSLNAEHDEYSQAFHPWQVDFMFSVGSDLYGVEHALMERGSTIRERVRSAISRGTGRLVGCKGVPGQAGMVTVIVLEDDETIAANLSTPGEVVAAFFEHAADRLEVPTQVFLLRTSNSVWPVWRLKDGDHYFPHDNITSPDWSFNPYTQRIVALS